MFVVVLSSKLKRLTKCIFLEINSSDKIKAIIPIIEIKFILVEGFNKNGKMNIMKANNKRLVVGSK